MILTIDAGNSRIKWALWQQGAITERGAAAYEKKPVMPVLQENLARLGKPVAIYAVCVAGEAVCRAIEEWADRRWQMPVGFLQTGKSYGCIRHGYPQPEQHGADRWAAVVASHFMYPDTNLCIIGAGTAVTFDFIDAGGVHRGGYILPSMLSMHRALTADTANVVSRVESGNEAGAMPVSIPDNTADGVSAGIRLLLQAGIRDICHRGLAAMGDFPGPEAGNPETGNTGNVTKTGIIISGGFAQTILDWRNEWPDMPEMIFQPDIVMHGLYRIMAQPDKVEAGA